VLEIKIIIFDFDGTLFDSKKVIVNAVSHALSKLGMEKKSDKEIIKYIGKGTGYLIENVSGLKDKSLIDKGVKYFDRYWNSNLTKESGLFPGVKRVLEHFKAKTMLVISNGSKKSIKKVLENFGIEKYFKDIIPGDEDCMKPSSCPIEKVINIEDRNQRTGTIIVGDMDIDIKSGKEAGIRTCGVTYGIGKIEQIKLLKPDFIIDKITDLIKILK